VRDFRYLAPQLSDALRFIRVDLPGFGGSAAFDDAVDHMQGRAAVVATLADRLGIARYGVLGHSMGGGPALLLAAKEPRRVFALVLIASIALRLHRGLGRPPASFRRIGRALGVPGLRALLLPLVRAAYRRRGFPAVERMNAATLAVQLRALGAADFGAVRGAVARAPEKTLVCYAADDHIVEREVSEELVQAIPHARVLAFGEGGHNIQKTKAVEIAAAVKALLGARPDLTLSVQR
jgi:pimeloyl-ACP methyl ester carboxylesterase